MTREDHKSGLYSTFEYSSGVDVIIAEHNTGEVRTTAQNWSAYGDPDDALLVGLTDAKGGQWGYAYTASGKLASVTQPGGTTRTWEYAPGTDLVTKETHPEHGDTTYTYAAGRLATRTTSAGQFIYHYDLNDRVTQIHAPIAADTVNLAYDSFDNRTSLTNGHVASVFVFDNASQLKQRADTIDDVTRVTDYDYDDWGNLTQIVYPSLRRVTYFHDTQGQITAVKRIEGTTEVNVVTEIDYHPSGGVKAMKLGNEVWQTFDYDPNQYVVTRIHGAGSPLDIIYGHDLVGNVTSVTDLKDGSQSYAVLGYDKLDRLTGVQGGFGATTFSYDALGNRTGDGPIAYAINPATLRLDSVSVSGSPQPTETGQYHYDGSGNLRIIGPDENDYKFKFRHTSHNMVEEVKVNSAAVGTTYRYDGDNQRMVRTTAAAKDIFYHGLNGAVLSEFRQDSGAPSARWMRDYVYLGSRVVASLGPPAASIGFATAASEVNETAGSIAITIRLTVPQSGSLAEEARVSWTTQNGNALARPDFVAASGTAIFPAGSGDGAIQAVNIAIVNDTTYESHETFQVVLSAPVKASLATATHTVTIRDEDPELFGHIDTPTHGDKKFAPFHIGGWGFDARSASGTNVAAVHMYLQHATTNQTYDLGPAMIADRGDISTWHGDQFLHSGFGLNVTALPPPGQYRVLVYFLAASSNQWLALTHEPPPVIAIEDPRITKVDVPAPGSSFTNQLIAGGWAIDRRATSGPGVDYVQVIAQPLPSGTPIDLGLASLGLRPDLEAPYGANFVTGGFGKVIGGLAAGQYQLDFRAHSTVDGSFMTTSVPVTVTLVTDQRMSLEQPVDGSTTGRPFLVGGWTVDLGAPAGPGVSTVHVWAYPAAGGSPVFLGAHYGGARPDVAAYFGNSQFTNSGFTLNGVGNLAPGTWQIVAYAMSTVTGDFTLAHSATITIPQPNLVGALEAPASGAIVSRPFHMAGWAADLASPNTNGVGRIDIWAFPWAGGNQILLGQVQTSIPRPDVVAWLGGQQHHLYSGWAINAGGSLSPGTYSIGFHAYGSDGVELGYHYIYVTVQ